MSRSRQRISTTWRVRRKKKNDGMIAFASSSAVFVGQSPITTTRTKKTPSKKRKDTTSTKDRSLTMSPIKRTRRRSLRLRNIEPPRNHKIFEYLIKVEKKKKNDMKSTRRRKSRTTTRLGEAGRRALRKLARQGGTTSLFGEMAYGDLKCTCCGHSENDEKMVICDGCDKGFHLYCLRPQLPAVPTALNWYCSDCEISHSASSKNVETEFQKQLDYFMKNSQDLIDFLKMKSFEENPLDYKERCSLVGGKKTEKRRVNFRAQRADRDPDRRMLQLSSLAAALKVKHIEYVTKLQYTLRPNERHNSVRKESMQTMSRQNIQIVEAREKMRERGYCVPVMIEYDQNQGFVAIADAKIPDRTLICEYVGEVGLLKNFLHDDCDSIMDLIRTKFPETSLIITPKHKSNMARFLSGINNTSEISKRAQNVRSCRWNINGRAHVLLFACRDIQKGERLTYDYNALDKSGYPTEHFS
jgi:[histone H3]-lysine27 N-methyltransferase